MLDESAVYTVLPVSDLARARDFYRDKLGLEASMEKPGTLAYSGPSGFLFILYETSFAGTAQNTQMCFATGDLRAEMTQLRDRGVVFEEYDFPGLKTEDGVAVAGDELSAWFKDSEGNTICISQDAL